MDAFADRVRRGQVSEREGDPMDDLLYTPAEDTSEQSALCEGMAFVSENLDAFGFVSDAYPVATARCLIAANGYEAEAGASTFTYPGVGGISGLYATLYDGLVRPDATVDDLMTRTFGKSVERREHPVARYVAALAESVAFRILDEAGENTSHEKMAARLGRALPAALNRLRENICRDQVTARDAELYTASVGICRITDTGGGTYTLDWFAAGDYQAYLLDSNGLCPLPVPHTAGITPEGDGSPLWGERIRLAHPTPFAILLLSGSAVAVNALEMQSVREHPGLAWRYRMRLETNILRIFTSCVLEDEFAERAARFFMGRANGRESASGAMALFCGDASFASFRAECLARLRRLEDTIALLPEGYDPDTVPRLPSRTETENAYIRRLLSREPGLAERTTDALCALALQRLRGTAEADIPLPKGVPDYRRLLSADVEATFRAYDSENDEDYAAIRQNAVALRENLSEHWVTLRPILLGVSDGSDAPAAEQRIICDRAYHAILRINGRLSDLLEKRRDCMERLSRELAAQALILRTSGPDWLHGRAAGDHPAVWAAEAEGSISDTLRAFADTYEATDAEYRSLLPAYMAERDRLFACDAERDDGTFAAEWKAIVEGRLPEERWNAYRIAILAATDDETLAGMDRAGEDYAALWEDLHIISKGTGARLARIRGRATNTRMARDIASRTDIRVAAIRASAYEDADWGEGVCNLLDAAHRNSYQLMVRRWQEGRELASRRAAAFEEYRSMYETYGLAD